MEADRASFYHVYVLDPYSKIRNLQRMGSIPVFLLKTKSVPNDGYEERLEEVRCNAVKYGEGVGGEGGNDGEAGFEPIFVPVLEHRFMDEGVREVKKFLSDRDIGKDEGKKYGGLIFTSQRAVELFAKLVEEGRQGGNGMCADCLSVFCID